MIHTQILFVHHRRCIKLAADSAFEQKSNVTQKRAHKHTQTHTKTQMYRSLILKQSADIQSTHLLLRLNCTVYLSGKKNHVTLAVKHHKTAIPLVHTGPVFNNLSCNSLLIAIQSDKNITMYMHNTYQTTCPAITVIRQPIFDAIYFKGGSASYSVSATNLMD